MIEYLLTLTAVLAAPQTAPPDPPEAVETMPLRRDQTVRIGDITEIKGMRTNALWGTGLIVGLNDTGDSARATKQALANFLEKQNLNLTAQDLKDGNIALVSVTAELPPFGREGDRIDVIVSATGGAESLFGGTLLFTPLQGADGVVYAVAQGPITVGGFGADGQASSVTVNHPTVGTLSQGATLEEDVPTTFLSDEKTFELRLHNPDFETATRIAEALNQDLRDVARTLDPSMVSVRIPDNIGQHRYVEFVAQLTRLRVVPHQRAKIVISERTGTIIAGEGVRINTVAIAHGNLTVTVAESPEVSQPLPFSRGGETVVVPRTDINATLDSGNGVSVMQSTTTISELAAALNALGANPRDLITILQLLRQSGALHAELEVL